MGQALDVKPGDLKRAAKKYESEAETTRNNNFSCTARLDPDVWGNLPESYKMANDYDTFYNGLVEDLQKMAEYLTRFADKLTKTAEAYEKAEEASIITVKPGDTLSGIAKDKLGDGNRWPEIAKNNPQIKNPDLIYPGDKVKLPRPGR